MDPSYNFISSTPADILHYENSSMLDTIFISKAKKKPVWITVTTGSQTTLFSVSSAGKLIQAAAIQWQAQIKGSKKTEVMVEIDGDTFPADRFGRQSGGIHGKTSLRQFSIDNLNCQWACKTPKTTVDGDSTQIWEFNILLQWECTANPIDSSPSLPSSPTRASKFKTLFKSSAPEIPRILLASYIEGYQPKNQGLVMYPAGTPYTALILISAIFTNVKKDYWKRHQSKSSPTDLEAMLSSDLTGGLPAYTPAVRDSHSSGTLLHPTVPTTTSSRWRQQNRRGSADAHHSQPPPPTPPGYTL